MWKVLLVTQKPDQCLGEWIDREALAEAMIPLIGQLYRNNNVVTSIYGRGLINRSVIDILKAHRFARHRLEGETELSVHDTFPILKTMSELKLGAASVDLGKMVAKFKAEGAGRSIEQFTKDVLADVAGKQNGAGREGTDVVLYGFGRIGRLLARILIEKTGGGDGLRLRDERVAGLQVRLVVVVRNRAGRMGIGIVSHGAIVAASTSPFVSSGIWRNQSLLIGR